MTLEIEFGVIDFINDNGRGVDLLPEFIKHAENIPALIQCILPEIQALHNAQSAIYQNINIYTATGSQLDDIFGEILNLEREFGQNDENYRAALLAVSPTISGAGTITVLKRVLRNIAQTDNVSLIEVFPHTVLMHAIVDEFEDTQSLYNTSMQKVKAAGVKLEVGVQELGNAFIFASTDAGGDTSEGFATLLDGTDGGAFVKLLDIVTSYLTLLTESDDIMITEDGFTMETDSVF